MRKLISLFMFIVQSLKLFDKRGTCFRIESFKQYVYGLWSRLENRLHSKDRSVEPLKAKIIFRILLSRVTRRCTHLIYPMQLFFIPQSFDFDCVVSKNNHCSQQYYVTLCYTRIQYFKRMFFSLTEKRIRNRII